MNPEIVREIVRELGTKPGETSPKRGVPFADSFTSYSLGLTAVESDFSLLTEGLLVRIYTFLRPYAFLFAFSTACRT